MKYYSAIKKNKILPFTTVWVDLEGIVISKVRERLVPYDFTYMQNLTNTIYKLTKQKQTHRYRKHSDGCQRSWGLVCWVKMVKGLRSTNWQLRNSHRDVKDR